MSIANRFPACKKVGNPSLQERLIGQLVHINRPTIPVVKFNPPPDSTSFFEKIYYCRRYFGATESIRLSSARVTMPGVATERKCPSHQFLPQFLKMLDARLTNNSSAVEVVSACFLFNWLHPYQDFNGRTARLLTQCYSQGRSHPREAISFFGSRVELWLTVLPSAHLNQNYVPFEKFLEKIYA